MNDVQWMRRASARWQRLNALPDGTGQTAARAQAEVWPQHHSRRKTLILPD
jgi:hypothetical protein